SQERFSESLVRRRATRFGNSRILSELKSHGIAADAVAGIKADLEQDETARAREVWQRKFGTLPENADQRAKQMRFLMQRGFSNRSIRDVLRGVVDDDDE
ncbi:MAG TPA: RecX family transcriptional regulator, partial [Oxalicibacterium sp.]